VLVALDGVMGDLPEWAGAAEGVVEGMSSTGVSGSGLLYLGVVDLPGRAGLCSRIAALRAAAVAASVILALELAD